MAPGRLSSADAARLIPDRWRTGIERYPGDGGPAGRDWLAGLPRLIAQMLDEWDLRPTGPGRTGCTAVVVPVDRAGERLALKLVWPHTDGAGEALALRLWDGDGAARLVAAHPGRGALLLEWLDPDRDLEDPMIDIDTACEIIGRLLGRLHIPAPPNIRSLAEFCDQHLHGPDGLGHFGERLPRRAVDRAIGLATDLLGAADATSTLVHGDLHFRNVLAGDRHPWLTIDPKPLAGHPGIELQPVLRNRVAELGTGSEFRWSVRRRLEVVCDAAGIDEDAARGWTIVISTLEAMGAARGDIAEHVSLHLALAKALDD